MKLLSEEEEDVHLDEGMQAEENIFSVDYDVWIDEETGFTQIDKYAGHLHALECPECSYQTLKSGKRRNSYFAHSGNARRINEILQVWLLQPQSEKSI